MLMGVKLCFLNYKRFWLLLSFNKFVPYAREFLHEINNKFTAIAGEETSVIKGRNQQIVLTQFCDGRICNTN